MTGAPADLPPIIRREANLAYRIVRLVGVPMLRLLFKIEVAGSNHIPRDGPYVLIANHLNWLDSFAILLCFPPEPRIHFLADPAILMTRRLQWLVVRSTGGYVAVDRSQHPDVAMFDRVYRCLELGAVVAIYPEGNYGPAEGRLLPFKRGFAHFALRAGVPVLPVALSGTKEPWLRKRIRVVVGGPIATAGHSVESLVKLAHARLTALLPPYEEARGPRPLRRQLTHLF